MENRSLEINVISARDIKDVNLFSKMDVYVAVAVLLSGDSQLMQKAKTKVDRNGGTSPSWNNFPMKFTIDDSAANQNRLLLVFKLRCKRGLGGDKAVGELYVPVKELLNYVGDGKSMQFVSYQVRKHSGKPEGALNFSYRFTEKPAYPVEPSAPPFPPSPLGPSSYPVIKPEESDTACRPVQPTAPPYFCPLPPPVTYAYSTPLPPLPSYQQYVGYPPPPGYWYPPQPAVQPPRRKSGRGFGAGLLGGIGGALLLKVALLGCFMQAMAL
ncbi:protein SRC2-like [Corylus avellana]|uniref:protein SRC2-like n=1 Tax=Corylus avellana TaxID=13451 RepID=UPI00286D0E0A|nr:protein SRC2-like [Corylus avellana]